jgi:hypothetical protein
MASVFFSNAQRIITQIFDWLQSSGQGKTANLITDSFQSGIDNATDAGEGFTIVPGTAALSVTIQGQGIAYDPLSNRIFLSASDTTPYNASNPTTTTNDGTGNFVLTPQSTGCVNIPLTGGGFNYLWVDYLATTNTSAFTLNKITNAKIFYELTDGYNIQVTTTNTAPDANSIFLGTVNLTGIVSGIVPSSVITQTGRTYFNILPNIVPITTAQAGTNPSDRTPFYAPSSTYTLEAHIKAVGTGTGQSPTNPHNTSLADLGVGTLETVVGHRQLEHGVGGGLAAANAIIAGTPGTPFPTTSAMAASINIVDPGSDYLTIYQLLSSEFAIINGTAYNVTDIFGSVPANASVFFPAVSGTYNVYYDSVADVFSVTTSDISADVTKLWLNTVTYTVNFTPGYNHLSNLVDMRRIGSSTHLLQRWMTGGRPGSGLTAPSAGEFGYNLTTGALEYWNGSVWVQSLATTAVDNVTINLNGSNQLEVKPNGITAAQIANNTITGTQIANQSISNAQISGALGVWSGAGTADDISRQASTDLWVTAKAMGSGTGTLIIFTDSSATPTTERAHIDTVSGLNATISCMVRKGDYWRVSQASCASTYVYTIPIGS